METRFLGAALALASLVPASYAVTVTSFTAFTGSTSSNVTGITNLLSALPAEYSLDGPRNRDLFGAAVANVSTLTDGQAPLANGGNLSTNNATNQFAVFDGDVLTYSLGGSFNLTKVEIFNSWNDGGRDDFSDVSIAFSTDGSNYVNLVTGLSTGGNGTNIGNHVVDTGIFASGAVIAAGATHVRFTFNTVEAGAIGVSELAVQGTSAIPEPSTYAAIFGVVALGAAVYRRRSARA